MKQFIFTKRTFYIFACIVALAAMLGSLYYSEIALLAPCLLCWYQRILMYPIVAVTLVGILRRDDDMPFYVLPLSVIGIFVSGYHYTIQMIAKWSAAVHTIVTAVGTPCRVGSVSCEAIDVIYFNFITIPLMAFVAFVIITALVLWSRKLNRWK